MEPIVEVEITAPDQDWLTEFTRHLVEEHLIACGSIETATVRSIYRWKRNIEDQTEARARFHTRQGLLALLRTAVELRHPYEVPGLRWWPIETTPAYHQWVLDETWAEQ